jgi:hypothetical protein
MPAPRGRPKEKQKTRRGIVLNPAAVRERVRDMFGTTGGSYESDFTSPSRGYYERTSQGG